MPLPFSMNIDEDLSDNDMDLDNDILYNFTDATSELMRDDDVTPWRGHKKNIHYSFKFSSMFFQNLRALLELHCIDNYNFFSLIFPSSYARNINY